MFVGAWTSSKAPPANSKTEYHKLDPLKRVCNGLSGLKLWTVSYKELKGFPSLQIEQTMKQSNPLYATLKAP